ncbi:hypothetical protein XPA_008668 [Xanthoria parietina]
MLRANGCNVRHFVAIPDSPPRGQNSRFELRGLQAEAPCTELYQYALIGETRIRVSGNRQSPGVGFVVCNIAGDPRRRPTLKCGNGQTLLANNSAAETLTLVYPEI